MNETNPIDKNLTAEEYTDMLTDLVPVYFENNTELKSYKHIVDSENTQIKELMGLLDVDAFTTGNYTVTLTKVDKSKMDEDKLLELVKTQFPEDLRKSLIRTVEFVDKDALETAMYNGGVDQKLTAEMAKCMIEKTEVRLNIKVAKGGKKNDD